MSANDRMAVLVHEVRSPVAALAAVAEALRDEHMSPAARDELVGLAIGASAAIERIVTDITVASVRRSTFDPSTLVGQAVASRALGGLSIEARVAGELGLIDGDPVRLRQALDNLVANALIHGGDGPVVVSAAQVEGAVVISVIDVGPGIAPDQLERIFEPGVRLDGNRPGSGLGLAIAREIVEAHGGTLGAASSSAGSTFTITLPAAHSQPAT